MIGSYTITANEWTPITTYGASAMVWKSELDNGIVGKADVVVVNSYTVPSDDSLPYGRKIYKPNGMLEGHELVADSYLDRYWAKCRNAGDQAVIIVSSPYGKTVAIHQKHIEPDGALRVQTQDNTSDFVDLKICKKIADITIFSNAMLGASSITFGIGHGVVVGNIICLRESQRFYQGVALTVVGDVVTLDSPLDYAYTIAAEGFRSSDAMNVDGSVTPVIFSVSPPFGTSWDIYGIAGAMTDDVAMDDAKFGGITALIKGVVIRKKNGIYKNIMNAKTNLELCLRSDTFDYSTKAPAGVYGLSYEKKLTDRSGVAMRLDYGDELQVIIQDNLAGLSSFGKIVFGHVVS